MLTIKIERQLPPEKHNEAHKEYLRIKDKNRFKPHRNSEKEFLEFISKMKIDKATQMTPPTERRNPGLNIKWFASKPNNFCLEPSPFGQFRQSFSKYARRSIKYAKRCFSPQMEESHPFVAPQIYIVQNEIQQQVVQIQNPTYMAVGQQQALSGSGSQIGVANN